MYGVFKFFMSKHKENVNMKNTRILIGAAFVIIAIGVFFLGAGISDRAPTQLTETKLKPIAVNGVEIPVAELQLMMRDRRIAEERLNPQTLSALQSVLVSRELAAQAARSAGLDRDPVVSTRMQMSKEDVLASAYHAYYLKQNPITDAQVRKVYDDLVKRAGDTEFEVRQIFLDDEARAKEILTLLGEGKSFADLAKEHSMDEPSRAKAGNLGWLSPLTIRPEFIGPIRALKKGAYTKTAVRGSNGWHIFLLTDSRPFSLRTFDELKSELRQELSKNGLKAHLEGLLRTATVDVQSLQPDTTE